jgi:hypothetical protein
VFHLENNFVNFLLSVESSKQVVFLHGNLGYVICSGLIHTEVTFFGRPKQTIIIIGNVRLKIFMALNSPLILYKRMDNFLSMSAISNTVKVSCIRITFQNELTFGPLVPFVKVALSPH